MKSYLMIISLFFSLMVDLSAKEVLKVVGDLWCPFNCSPADKKMPGYGIELLEQVFSATHTIDYEPMRWSQAVQAINQGHADVIVGVGYRDRAGSIRPKNPLGFSEYVLYVAKGTSWSFDSFETLKTKTLGAVLGYTYDDLFENYLQHHKEDHERVIFVVGMDPITKNIKNLLSGIVDTFVEDKVMMNYYLQQRPNYADAIEQAQHTVKYLHEPFYLGFSDVPDKGQESMRLAAMVDAWMLQNSEQVMKLKQKYGLN